MDVTADERVSLEIMIGKDIISLEDATVTGLSGGEAIISMLIYNWPAADKFYTEINFYVNVVQEIEIIPQHYPSSR